VSWPQGAKVSHVYNQPGPLPNREYTVTLTVKDEQGLTDSDTLRIQVVPKTTGGIEKRCEETLEYPQYNRCWGWHETHTYDLGGEYRITHLNVWVIAGPSQRKGHKWTGWWVEISRDGVNWVKIADIYAIVGEEVSWYMGVGGKMARYVRINTRGNGYVDWSWIYVRHG